MSSYSVKTNELRSAAGKCDSISYDLGGLVRQLQDVKAGLVDIDWNYANVRGALSTCITNAGSCRSSVNRYGLFGKQIADQYYHAEERVLKNISAGEASGKSKSFDWSKLVRETVFGAMGTAGSILNTGYKAVTGDYKGAIKGTIKLVGKIAKNTNGAGINWGGVFKLASNKNPLEGALGKYFPIGKEITAGKKVGIACNWFAEGFSNFIDNMKDEDVGEKWYSDPRFYKETISETLVSVGKNIAVATVVGGAVAAIGLTAAPAAIVVGAASVGVATLLDAGLNAGATWLNNGTEIKWTEAVSDMIWGGKFRDNVITNIITNAVGGLCRWGKMVFAS